jgi:hypothetical protein
MSEPSFDNKQAYSEGWGIFECSGSENGPYQIQRLDQEAILADDDAAWRLVADKARKGSRYHRKALAFVRKNNPIEWSVIGQFYDLTFMDGIDVQ